MTTPAPITRPVTRNGVQDTFRRYQQAGMRLASAVCDQGGDQHALVIAFDEARDLYRRVESAFAAQQLGVAKTTPGDSA